MTAQEIGMRSLRGLWVGDCIGNMGQLYNVFDILKALEKGLKQFNGLLPLNQFSSSDDTEEAIVLYNHIVTQGDKFNPNEPIDLEKLAMEFAVRYMDRDPDGETYGYGLMTRKVLRSIYEGVPWAEANKTYRVQEGTSSHVDDLFTAIIEKKSWEETADIVQKKLDIEKSEPKGEVKVGSCGNGAAMRVAPLGALLKDYTAYECARAASLSSLPTHDHPEGIAGAMAIAGGAWSIARAINNRTDFFESVLQVTPQGEVLNGLQRAKELPSTAPLGQAIQKLGNGMHVTCQDTVPLCIWLTGRAMDLNQTYEQVITDTAACQGDVDTTCAIVGGMYGIVSEPPEAWVNLCLPMEGVIV
jgi:ADP-ribosylglycohydrolase